jgi:antitoxin (DNA-binding transcriptional repressor) of toxin-antitoxin stability system
MNAATLPISVTATEFTRGISDYLSQVQYRGQVFDISRGKKLVARITPSPNVAGFPIGQLDAWLAQAPRLDADDADDWLHEIQAQRESQRETVRDPWEGV